MKVGRGRILGKRAKYREEISPMESMVNLVDVMLVFICGLLISIIIFWNVNMGDLVYILDKSELIEIDNPEEMTEQMKAMDAYGDIGSAVKDPKTGNVYITDEQGKIPAEEDGGVSASGEGSN